MSEFSEVDLAHMRRAISLSGRGFPAPNPHVGCVVAQGATVVGEGYHHFAGGPHAEVNALLLAKDAAKGATAYVTLEPCNHTGRTPPCAEALIAAGVRRVVVACMDPNPTAAGGIAHLQMEGITVDVGCLTSQAAVANHQFLAAMRMRRPYIVLKAAISLDGRIALPNGDSKWLTGPAARKAAHRLRAECGSVLVGRKTVEADNPLLTARIPGMRNQPVRIVLDPSGQLNGDWKVFDDSAPTIHIKRGTYGIGPQDQEINLSDVCGELFRSGVNGILVEGGAITLSQFLRAGLADRIELFMAPKVLGSGITWMTSLDIASVSLAPAFDVVKVRKLSDDLQISLVPKQG